MLRFGSSRIVMLCGPVVVKFPIIHPWMAMKSFANLIINERKHWRLYLEIECIKLSYENSGYWTYRKMLFMGIIHNWLEFWFYIKNQKNNSLAPTYFSFLGFVNIQKRINILDCDNDLFEIIIDKVTKDRSFDQAHTFRECKNFGFNAGYVKMVDYGSPRVQAVLNDFGEEISKTTEVVMAISNRCKCGAVKL